MTQLMVVATIYKEKASHVFLDQRVFVITDLDDFARQLDVYKDEIKNSGMQEEMRILNIITTPIEMDGEFKIGINKDI